MWAGIVLLAFDARVALQLGSQPTVSNDFRLVYAAAQLALKHGWPALYDFAAQRAQFAELGYFWQPFLNPPPLVFLVLPLAPLPFPLALAIWTALLVGSLVAALLLAAPGSRFEKTAALCLLAGVFPVAFSIIIGQPISLVALGLALSWWLLQRGHAVFGGLVLAVIAIKPQLAFLVPVALLVSGRWLPGLVALAALGATMAVSLLLLDGGWVGYAEGLREASNWELGRRFTVRGVFPYPWSTLIQAGSVAVGLAAAWRLRAHLEIVFAAGVAATQLATPYNGIQDLTVLAVAALLVLRVRPPAWQVALLALGYPVAELALAYGPLPLLAWRLAWLASLLLLKPGTRSDDLHRPVSAWIGPAAPA